MSLLVASHLRLVQSLQCQKRRGNVRDRQYDSTRARELRERYIYEKSLFEQYGSRSIITFEEWLEIKNIKP